jgi:hypothetical protein
MSAQIADLRRSTNLRFEEIGMTFRRYILVLLIAISVGVATLCYNSTYFTRWKLLQETPPGTTSDQVILHCARNNLKCSFSNSAGFLNQDNGQVIGVKSIRTKLSDGRIFPFVTTTVVAFWGFDKDGKLIDIWVWRTIDAL